MRVAAAVAAVALLVATLAVPATAAAPPAASTTTIDVYLDDDGDARWNVSVRYPLESESERAAFRELATQFENGDAGATLSVDTFRALAARGSEATGRTMEIVDVNRSSTVTNRTDGSVGVLSLTFRWTNFARVDGQAVLLGDVFVDGLEVESGQVLRIHPPGDYAIDSLPPVQQEVTDGVVRWNGPVTFDPGEPAITYVPSPPATPTRTATSTTPTPNTGPVVTDGWTVWLALVGGLVVGAAAIVVGLGAYGRRTHGTAFGWLPRPGGAPADGDDEPAPAAETDDDGVDEELLSDEERVERLLGRNGGRMKQADIVSETGWSNAKVSQLLSSMAEEGRVEKLQIGRENLISLPDDE